MLALWLVLYLRLTHTYSVQPAFFMVLPLAARHHAAFSAVQRAVSRLLQFSSLVPSHSWHSWIYLLVPRPCSSERPSTSVVNREIHPSQLAGKPDGCLWLLYMGLYQPHLPLLLYVPFHPMLQFSNFLADRGFKAQGISRKQCLHYWNPLQASIFTWIAQVK